MSLSIQRADEAHRNEFRSGWPAVTGSAMGLAVGASALPFYTAGVFLPELEQAFGWSRTWISFVASMFSIAIALASPCVGIIIDRIGFLKPAAFSFVAMVLIYISLSQLGNSPYAYLLSQILIAILGAATTPVGFLRVINSIFDRHRGLALGLGYSGIAITATFAPSIIEWIIRNFGWREAYLSMALAIALVAPISLLSIRRGVARAASHLPPPILPTGSAAGWAVLRLRLFWHVAAAFFLLALSVGGFILHFIPLLLDLGINRERAAAIQGILGLFILAGRVGTGVAVDRFFAPYVMALFAGLTACGMVLLAIGGLPYAVPAAALIGLSIGAEGDMVSYMTARYFGLRDYGRVYGCLYAMFAVGLGCGPMLIGSLHDAFGAYGPVLLTASATIALVTLLFALLPRFPESQMAPTVVLERS